MCSNPGLGISFGPKIFFWTLPVAPFGSFSQDTEHSGWLVCGQLTSQIRSELAHAQITVGIDDQSGPDALSKLFIFDPNDYRFCHIWQCQTLPFYVQCRDLVTSRFDDVD
jgi:hypothetical protein